MTFQPSDKQEINKLLNHVNLLIKQCNLYDAKMVLIKIGKKYPSIKEKCDIQIRIITTLILNKDNIISYKKISEILNNNNLDKVLPKAYKTYIDKTININKINELKNQIKNNKNNSDFDYIKNNQNNNNVNNEISNISFDKNSNNSDKEYINANSGNNKLVIVFLVIVFLVGIIAYYVGNTPKKQITKTKTTVYAKNPPKEIITHYLTQNTRAYYLAPHKAGVAAEEINFYLRFNDCTLRSIEKHKQWSSKFERIFYHVGEVKLSSLDPQTFKVQECGDWMEEYNELLVYTIDNAPIVDFSVLDERNRRISTSEGSFITFKFPKTEDSKKIQYYLEHMIQKCE